MIKMVKLKDLILDMHQGVNTVADKVKYVDEGYPIIQSKNITSGYLDLDDVRFIDEETYKKYKKKYNPQKEDLLVCNIGTIGKSLIVEEEKEFIIAWNVFLIKVDKQKVCSKYLKHYFEFLLNKGFFNTLLNGGTVKFINKTKLGEIEVPLPDMQKQIQLTRILDKSALLIEKRKSQIEGLSSLTRSLFMQLLEENSDDIKQIKFQELIADTKNGISRRGSDSNGDIVLRLRDVKANSIDYSAEMNRIMLSEQEKINYKLCQDDILLVRVNGNPDYVGRCAVFNSFDEEIYFNDHIIRIRTKKYANPTYLSYFLNSGYGKKEIRQYIKTSAGQYTISRDGIDKVTILLPPLESQIEFACFLNQINKKKLILQKSLAYFEEVFLSLQQRAFNGELLNLINNLELA